MDVRDNLTTLLLGNAHEEHPTCTAPVEVPFYQHVPPGLPDEALCRNVIFRKVFAFQVAPDLRDPCSGRYLSIFS